MTRAPFEVEVSDRDPCRSGAARAWPLVSERSYVRYVPMISNSLAFDYLAAGRFRTLLCTLRTYDIEFSDRGLMSWRACARLAGALEVEEEEMNRKFARSCSSTGRCSPIKRTHTQTNIVQIVSVMKDRVV